jgi:outer membrane protein assembly factor BamB
MQTSARRLTRAAAAAWTACLFVAGAAPAQQPAADRAHLPKYGLTKLDVAPGDWPQWGGTSLRNNAPQGRNIPAEFVVPNEDDPTVKPRNIKWSTRLGGTTFGSPVVAGGKVFVGTNNQAGFVARLPATTDLGCLVAFDAVTGRFRWQHSTPKHPEGRGVDWPMQGIQSVPLVDGNRLWYLTNLAEIVCLDVEGFADGENDGPFKEEEVIAADEADVVWKLNLMEKFGVNPHNHSTCSLTCAGNVLLVITGNGVDESHVNIPAPQAPSFMAVERRTAEVLWTDASPGVNILHGQSSSPAYAVLGGKPQMLVGGGDGWLYSFDPRGDGKGGSRLWWKFDGNPKNSQYTLGGRGRRNENFAMPVIYDGKVYVSMGQDYEHGEGDSSLWCLDPTRRFDGGDVSAELVVDDEGRAAAVPRRMPVDAVPGLRVVSNPQSAVVWSYEKWPPEKDGTIPIEHVMHRSCVPVVVADDLVYAVDIAGIVHCVDAQTGKPYWTHDLYAGIWGWSIGLLLVDGKLYVPSEEGTLTVFAHGKEKREIAQNAFPHSIYTTPVVAGNVLYVASDDFLYAIEEKGD